ncbi:AAA family ATPase [Dermatophilaceae bacterium Soc4.6]
MPAVSRPEPELAREQEHLARARAELARMAEKTRTTERAAGDPVSDAFLAATLARRLASLQDDPTSTLFFGRIDLDGEENPATRALGGNSGSAAPRGTWHVGRRHVADDRGDPLVIDWRAGLSAAFYRASRAEPMGVTLRRRFGVDHGRLTAYEDEHLQDVTERDHRSDILAQEIERPRVGPMRDIVATIQPEQDEIVRADAGTTVCVQGAPGTGKTAVGLHRAAWLLYAYRDKLSRSGVLVIGPNRAFLDHIGAVLPALGEVEVAHTTAEELVASVPVRGVDDTPAATLKGDARLAQVLHRAVWSHVLPSGASLDALVVPRGAHKWRVAAHDVAEVLEQLRARDIRYGAARAVLPQRLAHHVLLAMERAGDSPDDQVQDAVARTTAVKSYIASVWPALDPRQVLFTLWSDPAVLAEHADGVLSDEEQRILLWDRPPRTKGSARWSAADAVLLDELADLVDRTPSLGHVVLDEAQDLSPMQLRAVGRRCATGSATVLGDIAQGTTPWSTSSWEESLAHLGKPGSHVEVLDRGFRVPGLVIDYAARLLPAMAPGLGAPVSVRDNPGRLDIVRVDRAGLAARVAVVVAEQVTQPGSVGVIAPASLLADLGAALDAAGLEHGLLGSDHGDIEHQVDLVPATVAKGLEFDRVVVVEPARIAADEPDERTGLRRLYVVLTRAVTALTVVHCDDLPALLA